MRQGQQAELSVLKQSGAYSYRVFGTAIRLMVHERELLRRCQLLSWSIYEYGTMMGC